MLVWRTRSVVDTRISEHYSTCNALRIAYSVVEVEVYLHYMGTTQRLPAGVLTRVPLFRHHIADVSVPLPAIFV